MEPHPDVIGVTRRQFLNRNLTALAGLALTGMGAAVVAFLWPPRKTSGYGAAIEVGPVQAVLTTIRDSRVPVYVAEGRFYLVADGRGSVIALYQRCTHLGCRVPFCATSQWFECGCHNSMYNGVGEWKHGPAPRGLDRFAVTIGDGGQVVVDTASISTGAPHGTDTLGVDAAGPHCVRLD